MADIIMGEVDEVVENFAQTEGAGKPLLLPGLVATWPACSLWRGESGLRHLLKAFDGTFVQVMQSDSSVFWGDIHNHHPVNMNMSEFLEDAEVVLTGGDPSRYLYLAQHQLHHQHHEGKSSFTILNEVPAPSCLAGKSLSSQNLWMCTKGSRSSLHYDLSDNLLCVVSGSKTVTMYPPSQTPYLYPRPISDESNNHSQVNFANPDYERHPLYKQAVDHRSVFELKEGDALFIPCGWWHQVDSTDVTIAINFWWEAVPEVQNLRRYRNQRQGQAGGVYDDGYSFFFLRRSMTEAIVDMMHHMVKELPLVRTLRSQSTSRPSVGPQVKGDCNGHPVASYCQATTADYHGGLPGSNVTISCTTPGGDVLSAAHHAAALYHEQLPPSSLTKSRSCQCLPLASNTFISIIGSSCGVCGDDAVGQPPSATNVQLLLAAGTISVAPGAGTATAVAAGTSSVAPGAGTATAVAAGTSSMAPGAGTATAVAANTSSSMVSTSDYDEQMRMTRNQDLEPLNRYETVTIIIGGDASKATDETANPPAAASSTAATVSDTATAIATAASTDAATATTVMLLTTPGTAATATVGVNATGTVKTTATFTAPGGAATGTNIATATATTTTTTTATAAAAAATTTTAAAAAAANVLPPSNYSPAHDPLASLFASMSVQHFAALLFSLSTDRPHAIKRLFFDYKDGSHEVSITAVDPTGIIDDSIRVKKKRCMRQQEGRRTETAVAPHYYHYHLNGSSHEDECSHDCNYSSVEDVIVHDNSTALAELSRHDEDGVVYSRPSCGSTLDSTDRSHELTPFMTPMVAYLMTRMLEEIEEREAVHDEEIGGREAVHIDMLLMNKTGAEVNTHDLMVQPQESSTAGHIDSDGPILNPGVTSVANYKLTDASGSPTVQQGVGGQQEDKVTSLCVMTVNSNGEAASQPTQALTQSYPSNLVRVSEQTAGHERDGEDGQRDDVRGHLVGLGTREDTAVRDQGCSTARGRTVDVHQQQQRHNHVCNSCGGGFWVPTMSQLCTMLYAAAGDEDRAFAVLLNGRQRLSEEAVSRLKASTML
ncbi:hypothetical protein CEUSTIGMA_g9414.t1 [Chlamydomonas eustigma]|uniref:JmjC domain-containing protein n=1 Tax=Chlamydomonas eustigma TaxID=1157962 RepID=A0A250XG30_9CHLO|nr:hypothetical protein CEUSTIGMA_g9414.t1 [Chlamydomonas eustigma]|eukprot:GAX81986.1 hypothetical protein CEUSTIGMA_g9414.t1 [Chlamydomonas eustigma]